MEHLFRHLLTPTKIGGGEIKNRIAMAPMGLDGLTNLDGSSVVKNLFWTRMTLYTDNTV
jgi:2,4-dienoyl-CoA reductase-like NADH-dependent reductase (Old Yellow Enzyme family)